MTQDTPRTTAASETPETDAEPCYHYSNDRYGLTRVIVVNREFARKLERSRDEARRQLGETREDFDLLAEEKDTLDDLRSKLSSAEADARELWAEVRWLSDTYPNVTREKHRAKYGTGSKT